MRIFKNISLMIVVGFTMYACKQTVSPASMSDFNAVADSSKTPTDTAYYSLGSKTTFNFTGNPFTISFFSGEVGHRYAYRNRTSALGTSRFIFTNALNAGTQANSLHVMVSTNFNGVVLDTVYNMAGNMTFKTDTTLTLANIASATWTEVTPAALATSATAVTDTVDLSTYASAGKPVFIAFKYTAQPGSIQNKWTINNVNVTNSLSDNTTYTIANLNAPTTAIINYGTNTYSPGWVAYTPSNIYSWTVTAGTSLVIAGASTAATATANAEAWTIMGSLDLTKVSPDAGVAIKGITSLPVAYQYLYTARGSYGAAFLATNNSQFSTDSLVRIVPISIK